MKHYKLINGKPHSLNVVKLGGARYDLFWESQDGDIVRLKGKELHVRYFDHPRRNYVDNLVHVGNLWKG